MNEDNSVLSPQTTPIPTPNSGLENLSPSGDYNSPSTTRNFPVSSANLKPMEVSLPKDVPPQQSQIPNPLVSPTPTVTMPDPIPLQQPQAVGYVAPPAQTLASASEQPQVFVNPNPPIQTNVSDIPTSGNPFGLNQGDPQTVPPETPSSSTLHKSHFNKGIFLLILLLILLVGGGGFVLNEFLLNKVTSLKLISENSQFYLTLAVKKNPQAEKAKTTIKKFPGGDRMLKEFDKYYTQFTGTNPKNVLSDLTQYANTELLFARSSRAKDKDDRSERLINIVDLTTSKEAIDGVANFSDDSATYKVTNSTYKGVSFSNIKLLSEQKLYESQISKKSNLSRSISTPKPEARIATNIDKFIFSSDKEEDVKMAVDLSQAKRIFGMNTPNSPKSILDTSDHQKISTHFPKETFLKFFARDPITPFSSSNPFFSSSSVTTNANGAETEAKEFKKVTRGLDSFFTEDGFKINSYSLDGSNSQNSFKLEQSLSNKLPQKLSGVAPTFYTETQNIQAQWKQELKIAGDMKDSKSRSQREQFSDFLDSTDKMKKSYQDAYGIDYETDVLSWLDGQIGFVFNAGKTKKGPEALLIAETKNTSKAETMISKLKIPDYSTPNYTYDNEGNIKYTQTKESSQKFTKVVYKNSNIYNLAIPGSEMYGIKYSYYFAITKTRVILGIADSDQSIKEIIDFETKATESLAKNSAWQKQFGKLTENVNDIAFAEPVNLLGLMDYIKSVYPTYKEAAASYSPGSSTYLDDIEKAIRGYLKTIPSIGAYSGLKRDISYSKVFINIVELSRSEKKEAEDALGRLLKTDTSNKYRSVLGINSETTFDKVQKDLNKFFQNNLRPIIDPQGVLPN